MADHRRKRLEGLLHGVKGENMALADSKKDEIKMKVLIELESMFTNMTNKYNSEQNHDMMLFLLDIEKNIKEALMNVGS